MIAYVLSRPRFFELTSPLRSSTERCSTNEGSFILNDAASLLTVAGAVDSCSRTFRRVEFDKAWKTLSATKDCDMAEWDAGGKQIEFAGIWVLGYY